MSKHHLPFTKSNNWDDVYIKKQMLDWHTYNGNESHTVFVTRVRNEERKVRLNDFPDEPLYTLIIDNNEVIHFDDWPSFWGKRPPL